MDSSEYPADFVVKMRLRELERRVEKLESLVLKPCSHLWELNKRGDLPAVYYNGAGAFMRCRLCGHKEKC